MSVDYCEQCGVDDGVGIPLRVYGRARLCQDCIDDVEFWKEQIGDWDEDDDNA